MEKRRIMTAGATLVAAIAIGHLMQSGDATAQRFGRTSNVEKMPNVAMKENQVATALVPSLPAEIPLPPLAVPSVPLFSTRLAALDNGFEAPIQNDALTPNPLVTACDIQLNAEPNPGAMIGLTLAAPCQPNSSLMVRHSGLVFSGTTDSRGQYQVTFPAMHRVANVSVEFPSGQIATADTQVDSLVGYVRSALLWSGPNDLHIHALEFGADYGENGHVWAEEARNPEYGVLAKGGFLTRLGEKAGLNPQFAEVYSFPADRVLKAGAIRLFVEAEVTEQGCGRDISGHSIEMDKHGNSSEVALKLAMPGCDAVGDYLVLKTLFQDLKIARN